jgi:Kef-type K+ transport system membrane component KefB
MEISIVFILGIILLLGLLLGKLGGKFKLASVPGYLIAGLVLGPSILGVINHETIEQLSPITGMALGIIALIIGGEFSLNSIKKLGKALVFMGILEIIGAAVLVTGVMMLFTHNFALSLLLGGLSVATAPASTVVVVKELQASGPLTESLLGIVALDDMFGVMTFGVIVAIVKGLVGNLGETSVLLMIARPLVEIGGSIILGASLGFLFTYLIKETSNEKSLLALILGGVFFTNGVANLFELSPILSNMVLGAVIRNLSQSHKKVFELIEGIEVPIFIAFFALAGSEFQLYRLADFGFIGLIYVLVRLLGKVTGARLGGELGKASNRVKKYLGFCLMPQAGVAVGLVIRAQEIYPQASNFILNVVLTSVMISELLGPPLTRFALVKTGEDKQAISAKQS